MRCHAAPLALWVLVAVAGCRQSATEPGRYDQPAPLPPAPIGLVDGEGPPPVEEEAVIDPPGAGDETQEELTRLASSALEVTRESLVGRWTLSEAGRRCDLFLALTRWSGGYRAASRRCDGQAATISTWDVQERQVVLTDDLGNRFATLFKSSAERFDGATATGRPVSLSR